MVISYPSKQNCTSNLAEKAFFNITLVCDPKGNDTVATLQSVTDYGDGCTSSAVFKTKNGCFQYQVPIGHLIDALGPYIGAVLIFFGCVMTFAGAKFLFFLLSFVIGIFTTSVMFAITYNLFINPASDSANTWTIVLLAISAVLAIILVIFTYKFTSKLGVPIISALAGVFGFLMIYQVTGIAGKISSGQIWVQLGFCIIGGLIGIFIGLKVQFVVKTVGTAFIGANLVAVGASFYFHNLITKEGQE